MTAEAAASLLVALGREELALVAADRWDELDGLHERRAAALAALPAFAPDHLRPLLDEALATQAAVTEALTRVRDEARSELASTGRTRTGAAAYKAAMSAGL